jgi:hypothetical protein
MLRYVISFDDGAMTFPADNLPDVAMAAHAVVEQAKDAGVWIFGGGIQGHEVTVVATDGSMSGTTARARTSHLGGFSIVDVRSREDALMWAARFAAACRCAQEVWELMPDPTV